MELPLLPTRRKQSKFARLKNHDHTPIHFSHERDSEKQAYSDLQPTSNKEVISSCLPGDGFIEIGIRLVDVQLLDPDVSVTYIVSFTLEFEPSWPVGDSQSAIIAPVDT